MLILEKFVKIVDLLNEKIAGVLSPLIIVLMIIQMLEVIMRYIFVNPTLWAWDVNKQIFVGIAMVAGAYSLMHDTHVKVDVLSRNWKEKTRAIVELIIYPLFIIVLIVLLWKGIMMAAWSWKTNEHYHSYFAPVMWPIKSCYPLAILLLFFQVIAKYIRIIISLKKGA